MSAPRIVSQAHVAAVGVRGPQSLPHQVRELQLRVEAMPGGSLRVSTESARGWAMVVSNAAQLSRAVTAAFNEAQIAAYARAHGQRYDLDDLTDPVPGDAMAPARARPRRSRNADPTGWGRNQRRPDTLDPDEWVKLPDGRWQSPAGIRWGADTQMGQRIIARRKQAGLPV